MKLDYICSNIARKNLPVGTKVCSKYKSHNQATIVSWFLDKGVWLLNLENSKMETYSMRSHNNWKKVLHE